MKQIIKIGIIPMLAILLFSLNTILGADLLVKNNNPNSTYDYSKILFMKSSDGYFSIAIFGNNNSFSLKSSIKNNVVGLYIGQNIYNLEDYNYTNLFTDIDTSNASESTIITYEIQDSSGQQAYGFMYASSEATQFDSVTYASFDSLLNAFRPIMDSADFANYGRIDPSPPLSKFKDYKADAYIISFDQPDPYKSGYTSVELDYEYVYSNSATDYLEKILDTDRNDELVGFRYYSDLNGEEYTIFIKANN